MLSRTLIGPASIFNRINLVCRKLLWYYRPREGEYRSTNRRSSHHKILALFRARYNSNRRMRRIRRSDQSVEKLPIAIPDLRGNEEAYVVEAIRSTWISSQGQFLDRFEDEFAELCESQFALGVSNGTVALHLAMLALDVRPGDEVLVPSMTYIATANAVRYVGAEPVFVDVDPETWCIDPQKIEAAITPRTRGIIPVDLYGHPADMDRINHLAAVNGLWVVEDAAEAHAAEYKSRRTGSLARIGTFSFYGNKIFTSGEGGAVTCNDPELMLRMKTLRGQGMDPERRYYFPVTGHNFRMTNLAAAILCAQLERADELLARRREIGDLYHQLLAEIPGLGFQPVAEWANPSNWMFCITIDEAEFGMSRDSLMAFLESRNIETRPFFIPLHTLPPFREGSQKRREQLPVTDQLCAAGMNLPTYTELSNSSIKRIVSEIRKASESKKSLSVRRAA